MQDLRHHQELRSPIADALLVVAADHALDGGVGLSNFALADAAHSRAEEGGLTLVRGADEEAVFEKVERDRKGVKADLRITRGREVGVAVTHSRRDSRHPDDDLVSRQRWNARVEVGHHFRKLLARDLVI